MGETKNSTSSEKLDFRKNFIEELSTFLEELPYDFKDINSKSIINKYKKEIIQVE